MADFYSGWYYYGSGGALRLHLYLEDPNVTSSTTSVTLTGRVTLETDSLYDSNNTFTKSGSWGSWSGAKTISNGSTNAVITIFTNEVTWSTSYTSSYTKSYTATMTGIDAIGSGTTVTVSGSITIPKRPANPPDQITGVSISEITSIGCKTSWSTPANNGASLDKFNIAYYLDSAGTNLDTWGDFTPWATNYTTVSRNRATDYWVKVRAHNSAGWGAYSSLVKFTTLPTVPDPPVLSTTVTGITATTGTVAISSVVSGGATITNYQFRISTSSSFTTSTTYTQTSTSKSFSGLTRATTYYVQAKAYNSVGWGDWSATRSFTTSQAVPTVPQTLSAGSITHDSATISWVAPADNGGAAIDNYEVRYGTSPTLTSYTSTTTATLSKVLSSLSSNTAYYYTVRAHNSVGWGALATIKTFTTGTGVPTAPQSVIASAASWDSVDVSWSAPADDKGSAVTSYVVDVTVIGSENVGLVTSANINGLDHSTGYQARVAAVNGNGQGDWSGYQSFTTPSRVPFAPAAPSTGGITANGVDITSAVPTDNGGSAIYGYAFQLDTNSGFTNPLEGASSTVNYTRLGLLPGTTYYVRTAGINSWGTGDYSTASTFDTLPGYQAVLPITIAPEATLSPVLQAIIGTSLPISGSGVTPQITVDDARLTIPNPLWSRESVYPQNIPADADADVGLEATAWIPQNLFVDLGLTGVVNHEADSGFTVLLADATIPVVASTPMFEVGLVGTYRPRKYGDEMSAPTLDILDPDDGYIVERTVE